MIRLFPKRKQKKPSTKMSKIYIILVAAAAIIQTPVFAASKDATTYESASNGSELKACINLGVLYRHATASHGTTLKRRRSIVAPVTVARSSHVVMSATCSIAAENYCPNILNAEISE